MAGLVALSAWLLPVRPAPAGDERYAVPNNGSPYQSASDLREGEILHVPTGVKLDFARLLDVVSSARVIYIGESHDNIEAHRVQLEIIRALSERFPGKVAVGMEMFRRSAQPDLDQWHQNNLSAKQFRRLFLSNWGLGYDLYRPIFEFLRAGGLPLIGLKPSAESENRLRTEGRTATGLPEMDLGDPYHKAEALAVFGGHQPHGENKKSSPYEMLALWEEGMAETVAGFLGDERRRDWKLVVLAGGYHVEYGFGIPKRAFRRVPHLYSIVLPVATELPEEIKSTHEMAVEPVSTPLYSADFIWKIAYRVPPESKIRLGVVLEETSRGLRVKSVSPEGNAGRAGVAADDIILSFDGEAVTETEDLIERLEKKKFGDTVLLRILRGGNEMDLPVPLLKPAGNP